ncbi:MAG: hypothetical protein HPY61_13610 [Methanotrichaceae archaeon]|nr:hypothetical protein [Methanotrichaceae archaeon]
MDQLIHVFRFKINGEKLPPTEDVKQIVEDVFKYRVNRVLGANTTVQSVKFYKGSLYVDMALVTSIIISAGTIILNYKTFKESLKELISDLQKFLKTLFQAESVEFIEENEVLVVELENGMSDVLATEKLIEERLESLEAESKIEKAEKKSEGKGEQGFGFS